MFVSVGNLSHRRFNAASTSPSLAGFPTSPPTPHDRLSRCRPGAAPGGSGRQISSEMIYGAFLAASSAHRTFMWIPATAKPQAPEGSCKCRERKRNTELSGDSLLSEQACEQSRGGGGGGEAARCVVDAVFLEGSQRNSFQKRPRVFQQKTPKNVVCSMLTQLGALEDNTGVFLEVCAVALVLYPVPGAVSAQSAQGSRSLLFSSL